jgi:hypothetical protein
LGPWYVLILPAAVLAASGRSPLTGVGAAAAAAYRTSSSGTLVCGWLMDYSVHIFIQIFL